MTQFKLVPVEPTREMLEAVLGPVKPQYENRLDLRQMIYRAMLAAAPSPWKDAAGQNPNPDCDRQLVIVDHGPGSFSHYRVAFNRDGEWFDASTFQPIEQNGFCVIHWMPLPPPPATQESKE